MYVLYVYHIIYTYYLYSWRYRVYTTAHALCLVQRRQWPVRFLESLGSEPTQFCHGMILLMDKILHQLIWYISHYLQGFIIYIHPRWCRISAINRIIWDWNIWFWRFFRNATKFRTAKAGSLPCGKSMSYWRLERSRDPCCGARAAKAKRWVTVSRLGQQSLNRFL